MEKMAWPKKPKDFGFEYEFPNDFSALSSDELAHWLSQLAEWEGYAMRLLAESEVQLNILEESFECIIAKQTVDSSEEAGKKVTKDYVLGVVLKIEGYSNIKKRIISKKSEVLSLKRLVDLYSLQFSAISREISRRSMEVKSIQKGLVTE